MTLEKFDIPRKDWHDKEGRIYKDALIENFNAIETKLIELQNVSPLVVSEVDWNTIDIPDVTLDSEDTSLINLKSLINILGLDKYPAVCEVSGLTITKLVWYYNNARKTLQNKKLDMQDGNFAWFKPSTGDISILAVDAVQNNITNGVEGYVLGVCTNGEFTSMYNKVIIDYDMLVPLSKMNVKPIVFTNGLHKNSQYVGRLRDNKRYLGMTIINKRAGTMYELTMPDIGYEPDGQR